MHYLRIYLYFLDQATNRLIKNMKDFFQYLTVGEEDKNWGLYLNVTGKAEIAPHTEYPSSGHPTGYYFNWDHGRTLNEFQLNYITEGTGIFEDERGAHPLLPGSIMLVRPGNSHRYKPEQKTGWIENYIGFNGELAHKFLSIPSFRNVSVIRCGIREEIIDIYFKIFDLAKEEEPGFQQVSSGLIVKLLGHLIAYDKKRNFSGKHIEKVIQVVRFQMREHLDQKVDLERLAEEHSIGYAYLRKMFKKYTGVSPHQYHLEMRIMGAKELLLTSDRSIKEIAFDLGFESVHYFSRIFKKKTGLSPSEWRRKGVKR